MKEFLTTLLHSEISPFLREFAPLGTMVLHGFLFCSCLLVAGYGVFWIEEKINARIEMRPARSAKNLFCRICVMLLKVPQKPDSAQQTLFLAAPLFAFVFALFFFFFLPVNQKYFMHPEFSLLYLLFAASTGTYAFISGGWSSGTRFSFFGAVRMIAQSLSCQPIIAITVMTILMTAGASDLYSVMAAQSKLWFIVPHFPMFVLFLLSCAMLLAQPPFGSPKSKRELAGGIYAEYGGALYLLFLVSESLFLLLCAAAGSVLFLGGSMPLFGIESPPALVWLSAKSLFLVFVLLLMKAALPSWRTDQLMNISFKFFLPFALVWMMGTACVLYLFLGGV